MIVRQKAVTHGSVRVEKSSTFDAIAESTHYISDTMVKESIPRNFLANATQAVLNLIYPLISFPYVSRTLGPEGLGKVNFANAVVSYFIMFASLGIPLYASREIAQSRSDPKNLAKSFRELYFLSVLSTSFFLVAYIVFLFFFEKARIDPLLYIIAGFALCTNFVGVGWYYAGIEDYQTPVMHSFIANGFALILLFILVRKERDYAFYAGLTVVGSLAANVWNFVKCKCTMPKAMHQLLEVRKHVKPIILFFLMSLAASMYYQINTIIIGIFSSEKNVGYFSAATKLMLVVISVIGAFTSVIFPRFSYYIENKKKDEYYSLSKKAITFVVMLAVPLMIGTFVFSDDLILIIASDRFYNSIILLKLMTPVILFSSLSILLGVMVLLPNKKEHWTIYPPMAGGIIDLLVCILLFPRFGIIAVALGFLLAEMTVFAIQYLLSMSIMKISLINRNTLLYFIAGVLAGGIMFFAKKFFATKMLLSVIEGITFMLIYLAILYIRKDFLIGIMLTRLKGFFRKKCPSC